MAKIQIGSKYEETRKRLEELIRDEKIDISEADPSKKYTCYFCGNPIKEAKDALILADGNSTYSIDNYCYKLIKSNAELN